MNGFGIDLGTANTVVCHRHRGVVLDEPSLMVVQSGQTRSRRVRPLLVFPRGRRGVLLLVFAGSGHVLPRGAAEGAPAPAGKGVRTPLPTQGPCSLYVSENHCSHLIYVNCRGDPGAPGLYAVEPCL